MTSAPASRRAMATTLRPRSCPSSPGFASSTRGGLTVVGVTVAGVTVAGVTVAGVTLVGFTAASLQVTLDHDRPAVELQGGVTHHAVQVRDGVDLAAVGDRVAQGDVGGAAGGLGLHRHLADGPGRVE